MGTLRVLPNGWPRNERRTVDGAASHDWGWSHHLIGAQAVSDFQGEVYALHLSFGGSLTIGPAGNCYGSQF
jgi:hypothetical protein